MEELNFEVTDTAQLIAVGNGNHLSDDLFTGSKKRLYNGFAMAALRSSQKGETVKIKVTGAGLNYIEKTFIMNSFIIIIKGVLGVLRKDNLLYVINRYY